MKDGLKNVIIVGGCIVVLILFAIFSINRRNEFEIENKRVDNIISNIVVETSSSEDNNVTTSEYPYVATNSFFTMNLNCVCSLRCLSDTYVEGI